MREKIWNKLANQNGFTLAELMISMLVMLMVTGIVASGIPLAKDAMDKVVDAANARILLSTTATALRTELSVATNVTVTKDDGVVTSYTSAENGIKAIISNGGTGIMLHYKQLPAGVDPASLSLQLVSDKAATKGLSTKFDSFTYDASKHCFVFTNLRVVKEGQAAPLARLDEYRIRNIAPTNLKVMEDG